MAGINYRIGRKCKKPVLDAFQQDVEVTGRQVGTSDGIFKKYIAGDYKFFSLTIETNAAFRVTRSVKHPERRMAPANDFIINQVAGWSGNCTDMKTKR